MRIAFISDIHGHAVALEAVLSDIQKQHVDQIVCLGDVATIGCQPLQIIARLQELNCPVIMGNHDAALLKPEKADFYQIAGPLMPTFHWCRNQLSTADLDYIGTFLPVLKIPLNDEFSALCFHGSPKSKTDLIIDTTPMPEIQQLFAGYRADIMIGGHSHIQMVRRYQSQWIVNPGSVGNAFGTPYVPGALPALMPWAEYAILDWQPEQMSFDCRRVLFDIPAYRQAVLESDIPNQAWWLAQYAE